MRNSSRLTLFLFASLMSVHAAEDSNKDARLVVAPPVAAPARVPTVQPASKENHLVFKEFCRYGGWPCNHGRWQWVDELVVGFTSTWFKAAKNDHKIDRTKP